MLGMAPDVVRGGGALFVCARPQTLVVWPQIGAQFQWRPLAIPARSARERPIWSPWKSCRRWRPSVGQLSRPLGEARDNMDSASAYTYNCSSTRFIAQAPNSPRSISHPSRSRWERSRPNEQVTLLEMVRPQGCCAWNPTGIASAMLFADHQPPGYISEPFEVRHQAQ